MKKNSPNDKDISCRLGRVGGQAVLEGVMMKAGGRTVTTCRKEDKTLVVTDDSFTSVREKHKILNLPIIRGVVNFVEMMVLSVKTLGNSAEALGLEDEEPTKFEIWLKEKLHIDITGFIMVISVILGLALSALLFIFLPIWVTAGINALLGIWSLSMPPIVSAIVEGVIKIAIFLGYLIAVSFMPDIKRTFMYHGAEHKSIACFEAGEELTPENAARHKRFHPRCGTSFMFFMILLGIFAGFIIKTLIPGLMTWQYSLIRLLVLPLLMGIGYEFIKFAGKHDNLFTRTLSAPGLWVQRITTKEPTLDMLEVAIISLKCAMRDEYAEFKEFYDSRAWEKCAEGEASEESVAAQAENEITDESTDGAVADITAETAVSENGSTDEITDGAAADITAETAVGDNGSAAESVGEAALENAPEDMESKERQAEKAVNLSAEEAESKAAGKENDA